MKGILKWILILAVVGMAFFGFAYWRGYSPADVLVRIQNLLPGISLGGTPSEAVEEAPSGGISIPGMGVAKEALQVTRPARSQIWRMFEYEVGPGNYKFPIWTWATVLSVVAPGGFSILWALAKYFMGKAGVKITRPDNPKVFAITGVAAIAAILALWQLQKLFGLATPLGLVVALVYGFLLCTGEWTKFWGNLKNLIPGSLPSRDWWINLAVTPLFAIGVLIMTSVAPIMFTNVMRPNTIIPANFTPVITGAAHTVADFLPSWFGVIKTELPTVANLAASLYALLTVQFNGLVMLVETSLITAILAARRIF